MSIESYTSPTPENTPNTFEILPEHLEEIHTMEEIIWLAETYELPDYVIEKLQIKAGLLAGEVDHDIKTGIPMLDEKITMIERHGAAISNLFGTNEITLTHATDATKNHN